MSSKGIRNLTLQAEVCAGSVPTHLQPQPPGQEPAVLPPSVNLPITSACPPPSPPPLPGLLVLLVHHKASQRQQRGGGSEGLLSLLCSYQGQCQMQGGSTLHPSCLRKEIVQRTKAPHLGLRAEKYPLLKTNLPKSPPQLSMNSVSGLVLFSH